MRFDTARLTLKEIAAGDAATLRRIVTHPDVGRMLFLFPPDWRLDQAQAFIEKTRYRGTRPFRLGVYLRGRLIGSVGVSGEAVPDVYYFIDPEAQGQGYGREALAGLAGLLFTRFALTEIVADAFTDNPASDHILRSIGFARVGEGMGTSAARVEPAPIWLYRLTQDAFEAAT